MARARRIANVSACGASLRLARCRIFREISCFPPLNTGTLWCQCCVLILKCFTSIRCKWVPGGTEMAIVVQQVASVTWLQCCMFPRELKWYMNEQVWWPGIIWCKAPWAALGWICAPYKYWVLNFLLLLLGSSATKLTLLCQCKT